MMITKNEALVSRSLSAEFFAVPTAAQLFKEPHATHPPRFLLLYGSLRERSFSRLLSEEAARLLEAMGGEVKIFNPHELPLPDGAPESHPKVQELRELAAWSEGMVWCSPERHGAMTGIMKAQIDWIPLTVGAVRPTQMMIQFILSFLISFPVFREINCLIIISPSPHDQSHVISCHCGSFDWCSIHQHESITIQKSKASLQVKFLKASL